jgi:group I intron endonuclease
MPIFIYSLIDPFTLELRYVGKTERIFQRLHDHCNDKSKTHKANWIRSIINRGKTPIQLILEVLTDNSDWQERETYWIKHYRDLGFKLVNSTDGGDGVVNLSQESRNKIINTWLGRKHKLETLIKISEASKGRKHNEEWRKFMHDKLKGRYFSEQDRIKLSKGISKLTGEQVNQIRSLLHDGVSQYTIADMFHVHQGTISNIKLGKYYNNFANIKHQMEVVK